MALIRVYDEAGNVIETHACFHSQVRRKLRPANQSNQVRKSPKQNLELKNKQPVTPRLTILIGAETSWLGVAVTWEDLGVLDEHIHRRPPLPHLLVYPLLKSDTMP